MAYRLHVQLNTTDPQDRIIIATLEQLGERGKSRWVREVLFEAITAPPLSEILAAVNATREAVERLRVGGVLNQPDDTQAAEPELAAHNLDGLLDRLKGW